MLLTALLCLAQPSFDTFDGALDPTRWYIGVDKPPRNGVVRIPKGGWLVSRNIPDDTVRSLEVRFRGKLVVTFHAAKEPLAAPQGDPIAITKGKGLRTLIVTRDGVTLDGEPFAWKGTLLGTFRLAAPKGGVVVEEVFVAPRVGAAPEPGYLEARTVNFLTTPPHHAGYVRVTMTLWDVEIALLLKRASTSSFLFLRAPVRGAPVLGALATLGTGKSLAAAAGAHPLAANDWRDERRNLSPKDYQTYLRKEYRLFSILQLAQRAMNAALPARKELGALVPLAAIRHADNAHAAVALAQTQGSKAALKALRKALAGTDLGRASSDQLRTAAGAAARAILGAPPKEWPGFTFTPKNRYASIQQAKDLSR